MDSWSLITFRDRGYIPMVSTIFWTRAVSLKNSATIWWNLSAQ